MALSLVGCSPANNGPVGSIPAAAPVATSTTTSSANPTATAAPKDAGPLALYNRVRTGMSYQQVSAMAGGPGTVVVRKGSKKFAFVTYAWSSGLTVSFFNGKMVAKSQK